ncbi:MAG TPA: hypothetical protein VG722_02700 [Tepidisphaeraceae bacterium]|nr:hypothetical protein [Tepidisphaeraceae bacterium]
MSKQESFKTDQRRRRLELMHCNAYGGMGNAKGTHIDFTTAYPRCMRQAAVVGREDDQPCWFEAKYAI